ncbi:putative nuclear hormone receptor HR3 [Sesbania bispinosa]|nr:putative nuclear hormone receptor HR3 [Sesbania bispinosa]
MDPLLSEYIRERWENFTAKLKSTQIMDSESIEIPYTPFIIESPPSVVSRFRHAPSIENVPNPEAGATHPPRSTSPRPPQSPHEEAPIRDPSVPNTYLSNRGLSGHNNVNNEAGMLLWRCVITKAIEDGKQWLVIPTRIVNGFLERGQEVVNVRLPHGAVESWGGSCGTKKSILTVSLVRDGTNTAGNWVS